MARFSDRTRGNYRHGYKACYTGSTAEEAVKAAQEVLTANPNKHLRKISEPERLPNGQYRVFIT